MPTLVYKLLQPEPFFIEFGQTFLHGDILLEESIDKSMDTPPTLLFMHGGSSSEDRRDFLLLRQLLLSRYGLSSCSFDFIGHGSTGGELHNSTLEQRTQQASDIISACFDSQTFSIVAQGMSAHTAIQLSQSFSVDNLVLLAPEIYSRKVYTLLMDETFFCMTCESSDWANSDVWPALEEFSGNISIIASSKDETVPSEIIYSLYSHAKLAAQRQILEIPGATHQLIKFARDEPKVLVKLVDTIADTLKDDKAGFTLISKLKASF